MFWIKSCKYFLHHIINFGSDHETLVTEIIFF